MKAEENNCSEKEYCFICEYGQLILVGLSTLILIGLFFSPEIYYIITPLSLLTLIIIIKHRSNKNNYKNILTDSEIKSATDFAKDSLGGWKNNWKILYSKPSLLENKICDKCGNSLVHITAHEIIKIEGKFRDTNKVNYTISGTICPNCGEGKNHFDPKYYNSGYFDGCI